MLRTAFVACLLALLVGAPAALADSTRTKILRECQEGRLTGDYTPSQIRDARNNIPDDIDQYSNCRDVLTRALLAGAVDSGSGGNGGSGGSPGAPGAGPGGGGGSGGEPLTPSTDADRQALEAAATGGGQPLEIAGRKVSPGVGSLRNDLPTTLIVALALLAVAAVGAIAPFARRGAGRLSALSRVIPGRSG
ncbi:MAG TPA: hypothetical protein VFM58_07020 [Solirubrobacteraceae bacterium]|nr:hypothetical protein [Solirubrobacteraceae bacterium]